MIEHEPRKLLSSGVNVMTADSGGSPATFTLVEQRARRSVATVPSGPAPRMTVLAATRCDPPEDRPVLVLEPRRIHLVHLGRAARGPPDVIDDLWIGDGPDRLLESRRRPGLCLSEPGPVAFLAPAKQFLDYLLFLDGTARIAVEAKALDFAVADANGGAQVVQYAVILGIEWGVATNGRQWRLYQTSAKGPLADKLILAVDLIGWETDSQFETVFDQLWLVSKESLVSGAGPETWLSAKQLNETLKATLLDATSPEIKLLRKRLTQRGISVSTEARPPPVLSCAGTG